MHMQPVTGGLVPPVMQATRYAKLWSKKAFVRASKRAVVDTSSLILFHVRPLALADQTAVSLVFNTKARSESHWQRDRLRTRARVMSVIVFHQPLVLQNNVMKAHYLICNSIAAITVHLLRLPVPRSCGEVERSSSNQ